MSNFPKPYTIIHADAGTTTNGNPRRCYVVLDNTDGTTVAVYDEGYRGFKAVPAEYRDNANGATTFSVTTTEYRELIKTGKRLNPDTVES